VGRATARTARRCRRGAGPNDLWCPDFKGELGNGRYCYPLTVTDHASRSLLLCEALESTREDTACTAFERLFRERGLLLATRSDNGVPFAGPNALFNLSKLSVWLLRLGIAIERIRPGHPQHNGRHERMHLTLKKETTRPPALRARHPIELCNMQLQGWRSTTGKVTPYSVVTVRKLSQIEICPHRKWPGAGPTRS
jgi:transposase InsO family protein